MIVSVLITIAIIGIILYLVNTYIPMPPAIKSIINIVVVIFVILWLLKILGLWNGHLAF